MVEVEASRGVTSGGAAYSAGNPAIAESDPGAGGTVYFGWDVERGGLAPREGVTREGGVVRASRERDPDHLLSGA
jgi:hypothetical protein